MFQHFFYLLNSYIEFCSIYFPLITRSHLLILCHNHLVVIKNFSVLSSKNQNTTLPLAQSSVRMCARNAFQPGADPPTAQNLPAGGCHPNKNIAKCSLVRIWRELRSEKLRESHLLWECVPSLLRAFCSWHLVESSENVSCTQLSCKIFSNLNLWGVTREMCSNLNLELVLKIG